MITPLEKFRVQYPAAALIADLVSTHDGQYVVRAAVIEKGETLATGLAASVDIHIAEDRARDRAIALLGISADIVTNLPNSATTQPITEPPTEQAVTTKSSTAPSSAASSSIEPPAPPAAGQLFTAAPSVPPAQTAVAKPITKPAAKSATKSTPLAQAKPAKPTIEPDTELQFDLEELPPLPPEEDFGPPIESIQEGKTFEKGAATPTILTKPSAATIALESFNTSTNPVDLSDVIAQTDVELTRLGWSNIQGREYLQKNYGKRSRQQLTDEELMSFLLYLEEQP